MSKSKSHASEILYRFAKVNKLNLSKIERSFNDYIANIILDEEGPHPNYYKRVLNDRGLQNDIEELDINESVHGFTISRLYNTLDEFKIHFDCSDNATKVIERSFNKLDSILEKAKITKLRQMFK